MSATQVRRKERVDEAEEARLTDSELVERFLDLHREANQLADLRTRIERSRKTRFR